MDHFIKEFTSEYLGATNARNRGDSNAHKQHNDRAAMWARVSATSDRTREEGTGGKHRGEH